MDTSSTTTRDIPLIIRSPHTVSERRVTPSWTLAQFKSKLEHITGIPPSCQSLALNLPDQGKVALEAQNEDITTLSQWSLSPLSEIVVSDSRPAAIANASFSDTSTVPRYTMPQDVYESLPASVLAWKKQQKLGRFDPTLPQQERQKIEGWWHTAESKGIDLSKRCQLGGESTRRGSVAFIGEVPELPGIGGPWIGVILDEPTGKNDGTVQGKAYFTCGPNQGAFVRPDRLEVGDFPALQDLSDHEDLEEM